jgi:hypothetical protein
MLVPLVPHTGPSFTPQRSMGTSRRDRGTGPAADSAASTASPWPPPPFRNPPARVTAAETAPLANGVLRMACR